MIAQLNPFALCMSPDVTLDVRATDIAAALDAAREALPHLRKEADAQSSAPVADGEVPFYILTCLLCGATDLSSAGQSPLVALQEHQMQAYGFTPLAFQSALSVSWQTMSESRYVWVLPRAVADHLRVQRRCFMRATRRPTLEQRIAPATQQAPLASVVRVLAFRHSTEGIVTQTVALEDGDEWAWYGRQLGDERPGRRLVWPRSEWRPADTPAARAM